MFRAFDAKRIICTVPFVLFCVVERLLFSPYLWAGDKLDWAVLLSHSQCGPCLVLGNNWAVLARQLQHVTVRIMLMRAVTWFTCVTTYGLIRFTSDINQLQWVPRLIVYQEERNLVQMLFRWGRFWRWRCVEFSLLASPNLQLQSAHSTLSSHLGSWCPFEKYCLHPGKNGIRADQSSLSLTKFIVNSIDIYVSK